ncbi:MAG: hypothetical protein MUF13_12055, partial [Akkermansiaceae bacterium]|nr:hypothetical protein [Akkermansiaceae bacterium]
MKPKALPLFFASLFFLNSASAASFSWDITPGTVGSGDNIITGGAGTWNLSNGNWSSDAGANNIIWGNTAADEAIFGDAGGTVTIDTGLGITANKLTFNSTSYTISGNVAGDLLTLAGTTPTITVSSIGDTAAISAGVTGSAGITKSGAGVLTLPAALTYTGSTIVADGALGVAAALPSSTTPGLGSNLVLSGGVFSPGTSFTRSLGTAGNQVQIIGSGGFWA